MQVWLRLGADPRRAAAHQVESAAVQPQEEPCGGQRPRQLCEGEARFSAACMHACLVAAASRLQGLGSVAGAARPQVQVLWLLAAEWVRRALCSLHRHGPALLTSLPLVLPSFWYCLAPPRVLQDVVQAITGPLLPDEIALLEKALQYYGRQAWRWDIICRQHLPHRQPQVGAWQDAGCRGQAAGVSVSHSCCYPWGIPWHGGSEGLALPCPGRAGGICQSSWH
jgi:hypothetical protein